MSPKGNGAFFSNDSYQGNSFWLIPSIKLVCFIPPTFARVQSHHILNFVFSFMPSIKFEHQANGQVNILMASRVNTGGFATIFSTTGMSPKK